MQYLYRVAVRFWDFWLLSFLPPSHINQASPKNGGKHISQPIFCWLANSFITTSVSPFLPSLFSLSFYEALCKQYTSVEDDVRHLKMLRIHECASFSELYKEGGEEEDPTLAPTPLSMLFQALSERIKPRTV